MAEELVASELYEHINIMDIDPTFKPITKGVYGLRVNKLTYKIIACKNGPHAGENIPILALSVSVINNDTFTGRRLFYDFWLSNSYDLKALKRLMDATGFGQEPGESVKDWAARFNEADPPIEFRTFVDETMEKNRQTQEMEPKNVIKWNNVAPIN